MPIGAIIGKGTAFVNGTASLMARVEGPDSSLLQQANVTSIASSVFAPDGTETNPGIVVATVVFDALQTDGRWVPDIDDTGYNFRYDVKATVFTVGGLWKVTFVVTPTSGSDYNFPLPFDVPVMTLPS